MIPPITVEYPKISGDILYNITGGTIIETDISLTEADIRRLKEEFGVADE